ncbi:MAG: bifunctional riboflavin kinase/FAD synthetase [Nocardioidaceae bacterium]
MAMWRSIDEVDRDYGPSVVVIGNFDGVHRGHRVVIDRARTRARQHPLPLPVVAVTFDPHPMQVLAPGRAPVRLTDIEQRGILLQAAGVDDVLVLAFDQQLAGWSPAEFIQRVLVDTLAARAVVVGDSFRFGALAAGTTQTLAELGDRHGFQVDVLALAGATGPWSSSRVRESLAVGDVAAAADILGRRYAVRGVVVEGDHRGRQLGFPTANVPTSGLTAVPADGVYAGRLRRLDDREATALPAAISVGTNPTFSGVERRVEAHVLDRDDLELYGVPIEVTFAERLRGQERYDDVAALVRQMHADVDEVRVVLGGSGPSQPPDRR